MTVRQLNQANRSYRRFDESVALPKELLIDWVDTARICMSGVNLQPLKYRIVTAADEREKVFSQIHWAGLIPDFPHPAQGEKPAAYVVICHDTTVVQNPDSSRTDLGICAQTIMLSATENGYGGCMIGAFNRSKTAEILTLPEHLSPVLILALGWPAERVILEPMQPGDSTAYFRDEEDIHHVPKRSLDEILLPESN